MNFLQKLGLFILIAITVTYIYFSFFANNSRIEEQPVYNPLKQEIVKEEKYDKKAQEQKIVKIFVLDKNGDLRSVNRICDDTIETSCFEFAIQELIKGPTKWEKSKGFTSEIPQGTRVLSIRESEKSTMIDLSSNFEAGGGAESTYLKVKQIIKTVNSNTNIPTYLFINGKQANVIGGEGIMIKQPLNERSFDE
jgi:spore germination protein GerM